MNLTLLFIVTKKSKDESHSIIKLLPIIIPISFQKQHFNQGKIQQTKNKEVDKKLFLFKKKKKF